MSGRRKGVTPHIVAISFGVVGLLALLHWGAPNAEHILRREQRDAGGRASTVRQIIAPEDSREAVEYAHAVQSGSCTRIINMTWWMQERLSSVAPGEIRTAKENLCNDILDRTDENNILTPEGVEDQYIFVPGATIEVTGMDMGRTGLAKPTGKRIWMRIQFPVKSTALRDIAGNRISALLAGVNMSANGYLLKAEVLGNLEVDLDSISYDWTTEGER